MKSTKQPVVKKAATKKNTIKTPVVFDSLKLSIISNELANGDVDTKFEVDTTSVMFLSYIIYELIRTDATFRKAVLKAVDHFTNN